MSGYGQDWQNGLTLQNEAGQSLIRGNSPLLPEVDFEDRGGPLLRKQSSDLFSSVFGAYKGFKKTPASREESRIRRKPSLAGLRSNSPVVEKAASSAPLPASSFAAQSLQHVRSLSVQSNLDKPLPEPPPPELSPTSTPQSDANYIPDDISSASLYPDATMDSRANPMEPSWSGEHIPMYGKNQGGYGSELAMSTSQTSLASQSRQHEISEEQTRENRTPRTNGQASASQSPQVPQSRNAPAAGATVGTASSSASSAHLSGLMCNVHRTTGREPHPLVGATTTILGDKLYVFGGKIISRNRPAPMVSDLYELDLLRRHWTKIEATGDIPAPRYFHSMCPLGDTKLVCYGGMSSLPNHSPSTASPDQQPEVIVMSDIHIFDAPTRRWTFIPVQEFPQGRYAHCACVLPSSASFSSHKAPLSAIQHNPSTGANEGRIGINIDGSGGAEMVIVGGQDSANHYIEQISVFNLRSLKWTWTQPLGKSCGAYRSVVAPISPSVNAKIGRPATTPQRPDGGISQEAREPGSSMLIYSNYNFLDVKLELQIRSPDGVLSERPMVGPQSPPGLRFPNGGVIDRYFVVSGTYLTSSKQEYALWALDLRNLTWTRIDAGGSVFSQGSWNRGVLWNRRNTFVILGNRKRSLVDDYNHRRLNFSNVCMVELEAYGFYDNPRKTTPMAGFVSASCPYTGPGLSLARKAGYTAGGRAHSRASEELGEKALALRELADMDVLCIGGERIPINSRLVARRWGPYFVQLLREGTATQDGSDAITLRTAPGSNVRSSINTITPSSSSMMSTSSTLVGSSQGSISTRAPSKSVSSVSADGVFAPQDVTTINSAPTPRSLPPNSRPRCLYLPHTYLTVQALLHFLYMSSLPMPSSPLCTPQILCSLLQIARPYKVDGLLEAVVERLHALLDSRNAAAVFNATAMAAGGGRGIDGTLNPNFLVQPALVAGGEEDAVIFGAGAGSGGGSPESPTLGAVTGGPGQLNGGSGEGGGLPSRMGGLSLNTSVPSGSGRPPSGELSATNSVNGSEMSSSELGDSERGAVRQVWDGELSSVIGLQKRGLRGLMEGRRMRERTGTGAAGPGAGAGPGSGPGLGAGVGGMGSAGGSRVGLGIAGGP